MARRTSTTQRSSSTQTRWLTDWAACPRCPRPSSLPLLLPPLLSRPSTSWRTPTDLCSPLTPRSLTLVAPPRSAALRPALSTSSTRTMPTRLRLQCRYHPTAVTQPARPPQASLLPTAPASASPGSLHPSPSPGARFLPVKARALLSSARRPSPSSRLLPEPPPPSVGRCVVKGRSAARCTAWRTATCGVPPAAGKRPARDSPTELLQLHHGGTRQQALLPSRPEKTGRGIILHAFGFLQLKIATVCQAPALTLWMPLPFSSTEPFQPWKEPKDSSQLWKRRPGFPLLPRHSCHSQSLGNHSAAKPCKEKNVLKISSVFLCWVQCCIFLCFVKLWFLNGKSKKGSR